MLSRASERTQVAVIASHNQVMCLEGRELSEKWFRTFKHKAVLLQFISISLTDGV